MANYGKVLYEILVGQSIAQIIFHKVEAVYKTVFHRRQYRK